MTFSYCGFNAFNQWESEDNYNGEFKPVELIANDIRDKEEIKSFDIYVNWSNNLYILNSKVFIRGFHNGNLNVFQELTNPNSDPVTNITSTDEFVLFYNNKDTYVWKYYLDEDIEEKWKLLSNFVKVDQRIGLDESNVTNTDNDECILKIASSIRMNVALTSNGRIFNIPYEINTKCLGQVIDVSCGFEHGILLTDLGNVYTWGGGSRCQLGHGSTDNYDEPELVEALSGIRITSISVGGWHCCAVSESGDLYTWGWNEKGQLGVFNATKDNIKCKNIKEEGSSHNLSVKSSDVLPQNKLRRLDFENADALPNYALPMLIDIYDSENDCLLEKNIVEVACGSKHTVIKLDDGTIWGTGCNKYGQLGFEPKTVENVSYFKKLNVNLDNVSIKCGAWGTALVQSCVKK